ncbi:MAG: PhzF family phenazine biosynthesis protein [Treponema sp.]|nr:PhzF family phenazine biosynthesis protein [Treponema sp.]
MQIDYYHVDSFTTEQFKGNPAGVCLLKEELPDSVLLGIAGENGLAETAFIRKAGNNYSIRWFTPDIEMDLCGHATLASAYIIKKFIDPGCENILFESASGSLTVTFDGELISMDFPKRIPVPAELPEEIYESLSIKPVAVYKSRDYVLLYKSESDIPNLIVNRILFDRINLGPGGVCVTAKAQSFDFISRFFTPQASISEDPVTGSAHCSLIPFWSERLGKQRMTALQASQRSGILYCENGQKDRVSVAGNARLYSKGLIEVDI